MMLLSITLFFLPFLETFQSKYVLVSLDKSKSPLITGRAQRSDEEGGNVFKSPKLNFENYVLF